MATYGYARVSSADQCEDRQTRALCGMRIPQSHIYTDKISGESFERPAYRLLMKRVRRGDLICILSIDRLGRNYDEIQEQWRLITKERGVDIAVIDMPMLDTRLNKDLMGSFIADLVLQILSFVAHSERDAIRNRQSAGIAAARERGVRFGRPTVDAPDGFAALVGEWERGGLTMNAVLERSGLKESTFYRRLREHRAADSLRLETHAVKKCTF
jgi:DNA invertase Pin-like site-specific DNA recombinase